MEEKKSRFEAFLKSKNLSSRTLGNYITYYNKFQMFSAVNQECINFFLSDPKNQNTNSRGFLRHYLKFLLSEDIPGDQKQTIALIEIPKATARRKVRVTKWLTLEQIQALESVMHTDSDKLKLLLSFYGGLRLSGLFTLRVNSFQWEEWKKDMEGPGIAIIREKGNKERTAFFPGRIMKSVAAYIHANVFSSPDSFLFLPNNLAKVSVRNYARTWQNHLRQAGINAGITQLDSEQNPLKSSGVNPHLLRHSYATYLKNVHGMDIKDIQVLLGHSDISSTQIYAHVDNSRIKSLIREL